MIRIDPNTDQTRFDLTAMIQEWADFTRTQCGYEELDAELVGRLAFRHALLFSETLSEHSVFWDEIEGHFIMEELPFQAHGGFPFTLGELDQIWSDAFETINEQFDEIDGGLFDETQHYSA